MGVVLQSNSEFDIVNHTTSSGIQSTISTTVGLPKVFSDWVAAGHLSWDTLDASLGYDRTFGTPWGGYEITIERNPATEQFVIGGAVSGGSLGGSFEVTGTIGQDGKLYADLDSVRVFGGMQVILGDHREILGWSTGVGGKAQAGIFLDYSSTTGYDLGAGLRLEMTQGFGLGTLNTAVEYIPSIFHADELSIEQLRTIIHELSPSTLETINSSPFPIMALLVAYFGKQAAIEEISNYYGIENCFAAGTPIDMWPRDQKLKADANGIFDQATVRAQIWQKPIEEIRTGDLVAAFDTNGNLVPGYVPRTMVNQAKILLNFQGTKVTPGHVYYRADSARAQKFETLIDVLRDDGVIESRDGTPVRAATNVPVGHPHDRFVQAVAGTRQPDGSVAVKARGHIRLGTRFIIEGARSYAVADLIDAGGGHVGEDGLIYTDNSEPMPFHWEFGDALPRPEDYVLACSGTTVEDIYREGEWEGETPHMPHPLVMDGGPVQPLSPTAHAMMPRNEPIEPVPYTVSPKSARKPFAG